MAKPFKVLCNFCHRRVDIAHKSDACEDCAKRFAQLVPIYHEIIAVYPAMAKYTIPEVFAKLWANWKKKAGIKPPKRRSIAVDPTKLF